MALEAKNIYFRYNRKQSWILENRSISVEKEEHLAIFAPSGYGKTTLAMLLAGYLKPVKGQILLDGKPLPQKGVCPVQLIYQHPERAINPRWRLKRVLQESGELRADVLEAFGIEQAWLERFPRELSGGELQRFCVARAFIISYIHQHMSDEEKGDEEESRRRTCQRELQLVRRSTDEVVEDGLGAAHRPCFGI